MAIKPTIENLKPQNTRTKEEQRKIARSGGIASGKARREKIMLRDLLEEALLQKTDTGNRYVDITRALIDKADSGDVKAYEVIRDTLGQKPIEQIQNINPPVIKLERPNE